MPTFSGSSVTRLYETLLEALHQHGTVVGKTIDLLAPTLILDDPTDVFIPIKKQHWVWAFCEASDRLDPEFQNPGYAWRFRTNWKKKLQKEGGETFCYSYGEVFRRQLPALLQILRRKQTREAIISVWSSRYLLSNKEFERTPCTLTLHFLIRDEALHLFVNMRTNDAMNLLPYDILQHTILQNYVAAHLGLNLGQYHHSASHVYYQKRRRLGNIDRVLEELRKTHSDPEIIFEPDTVAADMQEHYDILRELRAGLEVSSISHTILQEIQSSFVRDWTALLIMAEARLQSVDFQYNFNSPVFSFIHRLGYSL